MRELIALFLRTAGIHSIVSQQDIGIEALCFDVSTYSKTKNTEYTLILICGLHQFINDICIVLKKAIQWLKSLPLCNGMFYRRLMDISLFMSLRP